MKRLIPLMLMASLGCVAGALLAGRQQAARYAQELDSHRAAWQTEKAELEAALARAGSRSTSFLPLRKPATPVPSATTSDPYELLHQLAGLQVPPGPGQGRALRRALALHEQLAQIGPPALPAIRQFLASNRDVPYGTLGSKGPRDVNSLAQVFMPPSLRFALFDVVRQIGGEEAEEILVEALRQTGRGLELAYLAQLLEELSPGTHREAALAAACSLLAGGASSDRFDRDYLFGLLRQFGDTSFVSTAQTQLVTANGQVDRGALRYLHQTIGEQTVPIVAQAYQDSRLTEPGSKEPLARLALAFVGVSPHAAELFHTATLDPALLPNQKRNLVEDLNQDGLSSTKIPTPEDLKIITHRYALTQAYLQQDYVLNDKVLNAAFREADKDLRKMLEKAAAAGAANPAAAPGQPVNQGWQPDAAYP